MVKKNWREELDILINRNIDELIQETKQYDYAISKSSDKSKAQLWVALGIINSKLNALILETNPDKKIEKKLSEKDLKELLKALESY